MARGDLHLHSTASDGTEPPRGVVALAASRGVAVMALTDHDTTAGVAEAQQAGAELGVRVIAGVELSADLPGGGDAHILGYFASVGDASLQEELHRYRAGREERGRAILDKLARLGMPVSWERVKAIAGEAAVGRPHFARALLEAGFVASTTEAFDLYLHSGGPADAPRRKLPPVEAVRLIRDAGGVAVLAHPRFLPDPSAALALLTPAGLQGVEVYYKNHDPSEVQRFDALARSFGLIGTGGSDFHGSKDDDHLPGDLPLPDRALESFLALAEETWALHQAEVTP